MFTGIVEGIGIVNKISKITKNRSAIEMTIDLGKQVKGLKIGQSVALNGVCLTATKLFKSKCIFEMIEETTKKTDLGNYQDSIDYYDLAQRVDSSLREIPSAKSKLFEKLNMPDEAFLAAQGVLNKDMDKIKSDAKENKCSIFHQFCEDEFENSK